ncbi:MAG TPA: DUF4272 domain-containing protein, partial [Pirellulales bacterium]|nr:DUF4272 domain-containing protein [Pirellulales bacterium]
MLSTKEWAAAHNISGDASLSSVKGYDEPCARSSHEIANRAIVLQGVAAVAHEVDPEPVVDWLREQGIWNVVSPDEQAFLLSANPSKKQMVKYSWRQE